MSASFEGSLQNGPFVSSDDSEAREGDQRRLASFPDYIDAQALVDRMSDEGFPVEHVRIIGDGVRTVEQVTGRMTKGRAALAGAGSGAWFGLLIGLIFGLFTIGAAWLVVLAVSVLFGAVWGAIFGFASHWVTRGRRDFSSIRTLRADRYDVYVDGSHMTEAARFAA